MVLITYLFVLTSIPLALQQLRHAALATTACTGAVLNQAWLPVAAALPRRQLLEASGAMATTQPRIFTFSKGGGSKGDKSMKELVSVSRCC
jgi:hypothetical protein